MNPWDNDPVVGGKTSSPAEFAQVYGPAAERAGKTLGVDPKVLLGQWGLETGWGKSIVPGTNNLGNIKDFAGGGVAATDNMTGSRDKYRAYDTPEAFADDYASLIQRKYPNAVGAKDPTAFATALKQGGYAEDPRYVDKVAQATRMAGSTPNPVVAAVGKAVESVLPSAQAATGNPWDNDPIVEAPTKPEPAKGKSVGELAYRALNMLTPAGAALNLLGKGDPVQDSKDVAGGAVRGAGSIGATLVAPVDVASDALAGKGLTLESNRQRRADMDSALSNLGSDTGSKLYQGAKLGAEIAGTSGVGSAIAAPVRAAGYAPLANSIASGGASGGNMLLRMLGGAINGGASAGLIDPASAGLGAGIGAAMPPSIKAVGAVGNALGGLVRPFYEGGQNQIVGNALRDFATDPAAARNALASAAEVVPGSSPITATAAGDDGIAALSRAMQNASPEYASNLAARQTAQNQARTSAIEGIAGNTGKIDIAKAARDAATGPMREEVLAAAGKVETGGILKSIDRLIAKPDNAGELSQAALNKFRGRIDQASSNGVIDARALYEIRKDINTLLQGKLQGEAGNLRYASGQLGNVKGLIDDAIDQASRRVATSNSTELSTLIRPSEIGPATGGVTTASARPTWKGYLQSYADQSIPIRQMEKLDEILKSVQTGTVDKEGAAVLSAAKLNNLLKNQGADLVKDLSPEQLRILRAVQADLNAGQIANNTGRAVGSNTVQNLAQNQLMQGVLGKTLGGSTPASSTLGRLLQLPYGTANKQIQERLGNALLNPQEAARLLAEPQSNALRQALTGVGYRAAPAISAR